MHLPSGDHQIKLKVLLQESAFESYRAVLQTPEGREHASRNLTIFSSGLLRVTTDSQLGKVVEIAFSSKLIPPQTTSSLTGIDQDGQAEDAGGYGFRSETDAHEGSVREFPREVLSGRPGGRLWSIRRCRDLSSEYSRSV